MFELTKEQKERLEAYPFLKGYVQEYIDNNGMSTSVGSIPSLTFFFKMKCINNGLGVDELFDWDVEYAEDFYSWGSNSRWANMFDSYLYDNFNQAVDVALSIVEQYGDSDIYKD